MYPRICPGRYLSLDVALAVVRLAWTRFVLPPNVRNVPSEPRDPLRALALVPRGHVTGLKDSVFWVLRIVLAMWTVQAVTLL